MAASQAIVSHQKGIAEALAADGQTQSLRGANLHLQYLAQALALAQPILFTDHVKWARDTSTARQIPQAELAWKLERLGATLQTILPAAEAQTSRSYLSQAQALLTSTATVPTSFVLEGQPLTALLQDYLKAMLAGDRRGASSLILDTVAQGASVKDVYLQVFQPCQREIGRLWQLNQISVAQEHYCTAATQLIMSQLYPQLFAVERIGKTLVATSIAGDLHEIGVRMVVDIFELNGWDTYYLGSNTPAPAVIEAICQEKADLLAVSVTLTLYLGAVQELIQQVRADPRCAHVKILVGGYPFSLAPTLWQQMGADGCAQDACEAVELANGLIAL